LNINNIIHLDEKEIEEAIEKIPEQNNHNVLFDLDDPDWSVFDSLPEWLQSKIKESSDYVDPDDVDNDPAFE